MKFAAVILLLAFASVATARDLPLRSLLSDDKKPVYCTGKEHAADECPKYYECEPLDKPVCKDCVKDKYGKDKCTTRKQCWEHQCVEVPMYCDPSYAKEDECVEKYGKDWECEKLAKEVCVYEKECTYENTHCKKYDHEDKCVYVNGACKEYNQKQVCDEKRVCKEYKQKQVCKPVKGKCQTYHNGKCTKYHDAKPECEYVNDGCKEYTTEKGDCKYVNTTCKEYKQEKKCEKVQKGCLEYEQKEVCEDVEVCWEGKCKKAAKYPARG
jgi:hypothetical protein